MVRWGLVALLAIAVAGAAIVANPLALLPESDADAGAVVVEREQGQIALADLSTTHEVDGELRFADQRDISVAGDASTSGGGTLTALAPLGQAVAGSDVLYEIDGVPTVALIGEVPAWRTMTVDDVGVDVFQLETNLVALGYDPDGALTVDDTFTDYTADVVEQWQEDLGLNVTGRVALGSVVFVPPGSTAATIGGVVGTSPQGVLLSVASAERELAFPVAAELLDTIEIGTEVSARLPDRSTVTATVVELAPSGDGSWEAVAEVSAGEGGEGSLPEGDAIPMTVSWVEPIATGAKTVRADALVRLDDGSYAIELVRSDSDSAAGSGSESDAESDTGPGAGAGGASGSGQETTFVAVEIGARSGSTIEIITDLDVGTVFIAP